MLYKFCTVKKPASRLRIRRSPRCSPPPTRTEWGVQFLFGSCRKLSVTHLLVPAELLILRLRLVDVPLMSWVSPVENPFVPVGLYCFLPLAQVDSGPSVKCRLKKARKKPSAPHGVSAPVAVRKKRALPFPWSRRWAL